jgi:hypothetical protein
MSKFVDANEKLIGQALSAAENLRGDEEKEATIQDRMDAARIVLLGACVTGRTLQRCLREVHAELVKYL